MAIRWGIIGCGDVTEVKSGPGFQKAQGSELTMVMRRDAAKAEDYARRHGVPRWTTSADELIADPKVDAVYIATPVSHHLEYALKVCAAGKPAYVEKPMTRSSAEAAAMVDAFDRAKLPLFIAFYRRGLPRFLKAREIIESGQLGRVTQVDYRCQQPRHLKLDPANLEWRLHVEQSGGGLFMDIGCHTLDIIDFLLGPLSNVSGIAANLASPYTAEDSVAMLWQHACGAVGTGTWNFAAATSEELIRITGTKARLTLSTFGTEPLKLDASDGTSQTFDGSNPPHVQQPLIQTIVDELSGKGKCLSTGKTALRTAQAMDKVLETYYAGRGDAFWKRPQTWAKPVRLP